MATADYLNDLYDRLVNSVQDALALPDMVVYEEEQVPAVADASQPFPYAVIGINTGGQRDTQGFISYERQARIRVIVGHYARNYTGQSSRDARTYLALLEAAARTNLLVNSTNTAMPDYVVTEDENPSRISGDTGVVRFRSVNQSVEYSQLGFEMTVSVWIAR